MRNGSVTPKTQDRGFWEANAGYARATMEADFLKNVLIFEIKGAGGKGGCWRRAYVDLAGVITKFST